MEQPVLPHAQMEPLDMMMENVPHVPHHVLPVLDPTLGNVTLVHLDTTYMITNV
jgi:hypothetical protein